MLPYPFNRIVVENSHSPVEGLQVEQYFFTCNTGDISFYIYKPDHIHYKVCQTLSSDGRELYIALSRISPFGRTFSYWVSMSLMQIECVDFPVFQPMVSEIILETFCPFFPQQPVTGQTRMPRTHDENNLLLVQILPGYTTTHPGSGD